MGAVGIYPFGTTLNYIYNVKKTLIKIDIVLNKSSTVFFSIIRLIINYYKYFIQYVIYYVYYAQLYIIYFAVVFRYK